MFESFDDLMSRLKATGYFIDPVMTRIVFLAAKLQKPLLLEGPAGSGKTQLALSVAAAANTHVERLQCYRGVTEDKAIGRFDEGLQRLYMEFSKGQHEDWQTLQANLKGRDFFRPGPLMRALECDRPCVLLTDELDKVNDGFEAMLLEILSAWQLSIPEFGTVGARSIPFVVLTSNEERRLGDPIRRRSLYVRVEHPTPEREAEIIASRTPKADKEFHREMAGIALSFRNYSVEKPPSVSEMIDFANALQLLGTDHVTEEHRDVLLPFLAKTREILKQLACLGTRTSAATLSLVSGRTHEEIHEALSDVVAAGLLSIRNGVYEFLHDRVQEAAYELIPKDELPSRHLAIGRLLAARIPMDEREERIFEIVNQINQGIIFVQSPEERAHMAGLNLIAGKRAKVAAAYASALNYLAAGLELLGQDRLGHNYTVAFALEVHRAECEFLTGKVASAEQRLSAMASRTLNFEDRATLTRLQVAVYTGLVQQDQAIRTGLEFLKHAGIEWSPHPTDEDVWNEYQRFRRLLDIQPIEKLIIAAPMTDLYWRATMDILAELAPSAFQADQNLHGLILLQMTNVSLQHGCCDASCHAFTSLNVVLGYRYGDYATGCRFAEIALDLVERGDFSRYKTRVYFCLGALTFPWRQDLETSLVLLRNGFRSGQNTGDLTYTAYRAIFAIILRLARGELLSEVQKEAEESLLFAQKTGFTLVVDSISLQIWQIHTLRGLVQDAVTESVAERGPSWYESTSSRSPQFSYAQCRYWLVTLQTCFFADNTSAALEAAEKAKELLWTARSSLEAADYHFFGVLSKTRAYPSMPPDQQRLMMDMILIHVRSLSVWAENCPATFADRSSLAAAELARVEGRDVDAEHLYEQAIQLSREKGFVQNEGLGYELASRFYGARGLRMISELYLRNARSCYMRWGAEGKVRQLDEQHPHLREEQCSGAKSLNTSTSPEQLDIGTMIRASQVVAGEIVLEKLVETLLRIAIENAGAQRGILILLQQEEPQITAEAISRGGIEVVLRRAPLASTEVPASILHYVMRTKEHVVLDDALAKNLFSNDSYFSENKPRSVLCLPILKQTKMMGALYVENRLTPGVFNPNGIALLEVVASQAAISFENALLFENLEKSQHELETIFHKIPALVWRTEPDGSNLFTNQRWLEYTGLDAEEVRHGGWIVAIHPDDQPRLMKAWRGMLAGGPEREVEARIRRFDGEYRWFLFRTEPMYDNQGNIVSWYGINTDIEDRVRATEELRDTERHLRLLIETIPALVWHATPEGNIDYLNQHMLDYTGKPSEDLVGLWWATLIHPDDADETAKNWRQSIGAGRSYESTQRLRRADGMYRWFHILAEPLCDSEDRVIGWYGLNIDVDDRIKMEEVLRQTRLRLSRAAQLATVAELSASIAHEINQPLAAAVANGDACLSWLSAEPANLEKARLAAERVIRNGNSAADVVRRIRALFQQSVPSKTNLDMNEVIAEVLHLVFDELVRKSISIKTFLESDLSPIQADRVQIQQVMVNLVHNAMEAMDKAGGRRKLISLLCQRDVQNMILIEVQDNGCGLPDTQRVFDPFFTTKEKGMGMGLSICRAIIEAHHGRLWATSNKKGTTFSFTLPVFEDFYQ
jgi:PAS domain S-box-containing protein